MRLYTLNLTADILRLDCLVNICIVLSIPYMYVNTKIVQICIHAKNTSMLKKSQTPHSALVEGYPTV